MVWAKVHLKRKGSDSGCERKGEIDREREWMVMEMNVSSVIEMTFSGAKDGNK